MDEEGETQESTWPTHDHRVDKKYRLTWNPGLPTWSPCPLMMPEIPKVQLAGQGQDMKEFSIILKEIRKIKTGGVFIFHKAKFT